MPALELCLLVKDYFAHKYNLTDLVRTQEQDYPIQMLKLLVDGEAVGKLPCDGILATKVRSYFSRYRELFYKSKEKVLMRRRRPMERLVARADVIILPQVSHLEVMQLAHDQQAHVGHDQTVAYILQKFDWPGLHKDVARYINSCHVCQTSKFPKKRMKFPLKPLESGGPNELLQVDHLKLSTTEEGYQGVLMMVDHFSKYAVAKPYCVFYAKEKCQLVMDHWISE